MEDKDPTRIVTRDFVLLFIGNFIVVSVYFLLMTTMAYYAASSFGVDSSLAGLAASVFLVGGVLGRILSGKYAQGFGMKRMAIVALVAQVAMCVLYLADGLGIGFLIAVRFVHGLSFSVANTVMPALAVNALPPTRIGEGTGYFMLSSSLGLGIGPLMSVLTALGFDYSLLFYVCIALSVIALLVTVPVRASDRPEGMHGSEEGASFAAEPKRGLASVIDTSTIAFSMFMFLVALSYSSINAFINSYAIDLGMGVYAPLVFLVYSVTLLITRLFTGRLQDRYGENCVLYPSIASMSAGLLLAAFVSSPAMLLACGVFMATGFGTCMSVGQAAAIKLTAGNDTSRTISTFFLLCDGGCGIGPFIWGFVLSGFGYQGMYVTCAVVALCAVLYYRVVCSRKMLRCRA
ncbi:MULTISPECIES: MFS transporter [unclassified Adlercreutzia]|uniref:MFS transporter n=1 Tax=unclassified Adlercreutzia TaxID=2636013 RepID=UPI0013EBAA89|nr:MULTISPECIES: MFS transporter [unclassified Adlercreutzia]